MESLTTAASPAIQPPERKFKLGDISGNSNAAEEEGAGEGVGAFSLPDLFG